MNQMLTPREQPMNVARKSGSEGTNGSVLIVEDSYTVAMLCEQFTTAAGFAATILVSLMTEPSRGAALEFEEIVNSPRS